MDFYIGYGARIGFNLSWSWSSSNLFCSARLFGPVVNNRCLMLFELLLIIVKHLLLPLPMWKFKIQLPFSVLKTISRQFLVVIVARYVSPFGVYATRSALSLGKMTQAFFALIFSVQTTELFALVRYNSILNPTHLNSTEFYPNYRTQLKLNLNSS